MLTTKNINWPLVISVLILLFIVGGWFYSYGHLAARVDGLAQGQAEIRQEIRATREEIRTARQEIRESKADVIAAIAGHEHDDKGKVFFRTPP